MNFTRKKKRGVNKAVCKMWFSDEGYRITWRKETFGVAVEPRYMAAVRVLVPNYGLSEFVMWDKVDPGRPRLYKTMKIAQESCEAHFGLWTKACEVTGIRALLDLFGKMPGSIPMWARKGKLNRNILAILMAPHKRKYEEEEECQDTSDGCEPNPSDPTKTLDSSAGPTEAMAEALAKNAIPASLAEEEAGSTTPKTRRARSKATSTETGSPAPTAKEAKAPRKRVSKPTEKSSPNMKPKKRTTKPPSKPVKKPAPNSRKKKFKQSES